MKKLFHKLAICMAMMALLVFTGVIADAADFGTIKYEAYPENGIVSVSNYEGYAKIVLEPASGYMTAEVSLKTDTGKSVKVDAYGEPNVFYCSVPEEASTLTVSFRRARVVLSQEQLAMPLNSSATISAKISYTDGDTATRDDVLYEDVIWSIDTASDDILHFEQGHLVSGNQKGYAVVTATPTYGNAGSAASFYVLVENNDEPAIGTIQVNSYFDAERFMNEGNTGTSFLTFRNTGMSEVSIPTTGFYKVFLPTKDYKDISTLTGTNDPVTFYYATEGVAASDENEAARKALAEKYFTVTAGGEAYGVKSGDVVTFGNYGQLGSNESLFSVVLGGDFEEALERHGKTWTAKKLINNLLEGRINLDQFSDALVALADEIGYDLEDGYNPFNYVNQNGGVCLNYELYMQAYDTDFAGAAGMSTKITQVELDALIDFLSKNSYSLLSNNSANVAIAGWNLVTASHPTYKLDDTITSTSTVLTMPMLAKSNIMLTSSSLAADSNVNLYSSVGVIKPGTAASTSTTDSVIYSLFGQIRNYLNVNIITLSTGQTYETNKPGSWSTTTVNVAYVNKKGTIYALMSGYALVTSTDEETGAINAYLVIVR